MTENRRYSMKKRGGALFYFKDGVVMSDEDVLFDLNMLNDTNIFFKSELSRYKEVNRLDVWKSSYNSEDALIAELQDKCDKKQEHIIHLENKIHRMREDIKRLEALYHYRGYIGSGDVKKEYYRMEKLLRAENNKLKEENEQLKSEKEDMQILINNISDQRDEFHRAVRENANRVGELKKENEDLKKDVRRLHSEVCRRRGY